MDTTTIADEVRAWLDATWEPSMPVDEFRQHLADSGWGAPTWPDGYYGRGLTTELANVVAAAFARANAPGANMSPPHGVWLAAPSILEHGSHEQKRHFLRRILTGEDRWCQLFSEPGNGSDLAGLQTTAVRHGDEWIVNGQKVWTSSARAASIGMMPARTDWDAPKHQGISWFGMPLDQPGVDIRPLRQMNGGAEFNEVFLTDARVPHFNLVGSLNEGWKVTQTTLMHERAPMPVIPGRTYSPQTQGRAAARPAAVPPIRTGAATGVVTLAREAGLDRDPVVRQRIAQLYMLSEVGRLNNERAASSRRAGRSQGPEGSLAKLAQSAIGRASRDLGMALLGAAGMLAGPDAPMRGSIQQQCLSSPSTSIAGGTDEIQHNILGERVLGLPREPQVDLGVPFREVKQNATRWTT